MMIQGGSDKKGSSSCLFCRHCSAIGCPLIIHYRSRDNSLVFRHAPLGESCPSGLNFRLCNTLYYNEIICNAEWVFIMGMMSMRLPDELSDQLDALAAATGRSKSFLAGQAIRDFIERESWQIAEITQAMQEADAGDFASDEALNAVSAKWSNNAG